ncbi:hypothetical protein HPC49_16735 [Pyxidicoccus fallax]|uniref:Uncharacterized protein n=1 Tax=Pyxidicoccus fallax TaxID=394095 RepID=A0A848LJE8_9BACT|nr:hypothetical protein [Pyxidicoccus fallax]NMO17824.1 hypothetical protein [Pyxidicoccus fallax]NPC79864.1 hypothetical protein [Pyxidicoccus fallax]
MAASHPTPPGPASGTPSGAPVAQRGLAGRLLQERALPAGDSRPALSHSGPLRE